MLKYGYMQYHSEMLGDTMSRQQHQTRLKNDKGFTIVELLIVVVIVGILATITIVAYNGMQKRANASAAQSALSQANKKLALYQIENNGGYPENLSAINLSDGEVTYQYSNSPATSYCITATSGNVSYHASDTNKSPAEGGCDGHGVGGAPAITNYALNPMLRTSTTSWNAATRVADAQSASGWAAEKASAGSQMYFNTTLPSSATSGVYAIDLWLPTDETVESRSVRLWAERTNSPYTQWVTLSPPVNVTITKSKQRFYTAFTKPVGETTGYFGIRDATGNRVRAAGAFVAITTGSPAFADGDSTGWIWNGPANAATSTGPAS